MHPQDECSAKREKTKDNSNNEYSNILGSALSNWVGFRIVTLCVYSLFHSTLNCTLNLNRVRA